MKEKGFTLIELLAVIVILAVIALIATPLIMGVIGEAKEGALKTSVRTLIDSAELEYAKQLMINQNPSLAFEDIPYKGQKFEKGNISFDLKGQASIAVYENNMCIYKTPTDKDVILDKTINEEECLGKIELAVTPTSCFAYEKINYVDSYEIDVDACKTYFTTDGFFNESEIDTICNGGELENGYTIKDEIYYYGDDFLIEQGVIVNIVKKEGINIYGYYCNEGNSGGNPIITDVVIPEQIDGLDVIYISKVDYNSSDPNPGAFESKNLTSVKLPSKLRYIGDSAFDYNNLIDTVSIPSSVEYIGSGAFGIFGDGVSNSNLNNIVNYSNKMFDWAEVIDGFDYSDPSITDFVTIQPSGKIAAITNEPLEYDVNNFMRIDDYGDLIFENIPDDLIINYQNSSISTWTKVVENVNYSRNDNLKIQFIRNNKIILECVFEISIST